MEGEPKLIVVSIGGHSLPIASKIHITPRLDSKGGLN